MVADAEITERTQYLKINSIEENGVEAMMTHRRKFFSDSYRVAGLADG